MEVLDLIYRMMGKVSTYHEAVSTHVISLFNIYMTDESKDYQWEPHYYMGKL